MTRTSRSATPSLGLREGRGLPLRTAAVGLQAEPVPLRQGAQPLAADRCRSLACEEPGRTADGARWAREAPSASSTPGLHLRSLGVRVSQDHRPLLPRRPGAAVPRDAGKLSTGCEHLVTWLLGREGALGRVEGDLGAVSGDTAGPRGERGQHRAGRADSALRGGRRGTPLPSQCECGTAG